jgi:protein-glutamine gamma-glutamyltransferase
MIEISGNIVDPGVISGAYPPWGVERKIIHILSSSSRNYEYRSEEQLKFELNLRKNIIISSGELYRSRMAFSTFRESRCNPAYWERTEQGGFLLKAGVQPADAVRDIFINGRMYATECSTAIVIVYYKALADLFSAEQFNELFSAINLMNWQHLDRDLGVRTYRNQLDFLPGDCRYFKNPDVDPLTPEWQGENAIDMGDGTYYGHGMGITTADRIIASLNMRRMEGSNVSAYLMDTATRPDFKSLSDKYYGFTAGPRAAKRCA